MTLMFVQQINEIFELRYAHPRNANVQVFASANRSLEDELALGEHLITKDIVCSRPVYAPTSHIQS